MRRLWCWLAHRRYWRKRINVEFSIQEIHCQLCCPAVHRTEEGWVKP